MKKDEMLTIEQIKGKYFYNDDTKDFAKKHILLLANSEKRRRNDGVYDNLSETYKQNCVNRINKYILNRTEEEKRLPEYSIFINSMKQSLNIITK